MDTLSAQVVRADNQYRQTPHFLSWDGKQDIERGIGIGAGVCAFGWGVLLGILHCDGMMDGRMIPIYDMI
jgi:hypothetical protein